MEAEVRVCEFGVQSRDAEHGSGRGLARGGPSSRPKVGAPQDDHAGPPCPPDGGTNEGDPTQGDHPNDAGPPYPHDVCNTEVDLAHGPLSYKESRFRRAVARTSVATNSSRVTAAGADWAAAAGETYFRDWRPSCVGRNAVLIVAQAYASDERAYASSDASDVCVAVAAPQAGVTDWASSGASLLGMGWLCPSEPVELVLSSVYPRGHPETRQMKK